MLLFNLSAFGGINHFLTTKHHLSALAKNPILIGKP